jgi:hypothetical protein
MIEQIFHFTDITFLKKSIISKTNTSKKYLSDSLYITGNVRAKSGRF